MFNALKENFVVGNREGVLRVTLQPSSFLRVTLNSFERRISELNVHEPYNSRLPTDHVFQTQREHCTCGSRGSGSNPQTVAEFCIVHVADFLWFLEVRMSDSWRLAPRFQKTDETGC